MVFTKIKPGQAFNNMRKMNRKQDTCRKDAQTKYTCKIFDPELPSATMKNDEKPKNKSRKSSQIGNTCKPQDVPLGRKFEYSILPLF